MQKQLTLNLQGSRERTRAVQPSPLVGKIRDNEGRPLIADHACKGQRRYRYYVSQAAKQGGTAGLRIPAHEIEGAVRERLAQLFDDGLGLLDVTGLAADAAGLQRLEADCERIGSLVRHREVGLVEKLVSAVRVLDGSIEVDCPTAAIAAELALRYDAAPSPVITLLMDVRLTRLGHVMRLIQTNGAAVGREPASSLIKPILQARRWWAELRQGQSDLTAIAKRARLTTSYVSRVVRLAFLSPEVLEAILAGRQRYGVNRVMLTAPGGLPADWQEQRRTMLPNIGPI